jgi:hypothetical protein
MDRERNELIVYGEVETAYLVVLYQFFITTDHRLVRLSAVNVVMQTASVAKE